MLVHFVAGRMDDCASPACLWGQYSGGGKGDGGESPVTGVIAGNHRQIVSPVTGVIAGRLTDSSREILMISSRIFITKAVAIFT